MKTLAQEINNLLEITEMANVGYRRTGIPDIKVNVYCQADKELQHGPRVKISNVYGKFRKDDCFSVSLTAFKVMEGQVKIKEKELQKVIQWLKLNKKQLLDYWKSDGEIDTDEFLDSLVKLEIR